MGLDPDEPQRLVLAAIDLYIERQVLVQQIAREEGVCQWVWPVVGGDAE